jgi:hypothetical protein
MALHQAIQRLLLIGVHLPRPPRPPAPTPPPLLLPLIEAIAPAHQAFDERAVHFGHRYRSGFWAIYLLSAIAVLCAILPLALGWDDRRHLLHPFIGLWAVAEVCIIAAVSAIYWQGHRRDWQGQWLRTRTIAELTWYLPLLAPLVDFSQPADDANWYLRVFDPGQNPSGPDEVAALCARSEPLARKILEHAWSDLQFALSYARWTVAILDEQLHYHHGVAVKQHALQHRVHGLNNWLFGLTAIGALMHLVLHTMWLSLVTTFFPALGASLHGALAQSEAYRLGVTSERLVVGLQGSIDRIRAMAEDTGSTPGAESIKVTIQAAIALILEEHQDWQMLVRPHRLPLG